MPKGLREIAEEARRQAKIPDSRYGYPIRSAKDEGVDDYLKNNPHVAGMAWGGGENGTDLKSPRVIIANEYNQYMKDPKRREGLYKVEAARHLMSEEKYKPKFPISPEQQKWRKNLGDYSKNDDAFKKSILSREIARDVVPGITQIQQTEANDLDARLRKRK